MFAATTATVAVHLPLSGDERQEEQGHDKDLRVQERGNEGPLKTHAA